MKTNWATLLLAGLLASGFPNGVALAQDSSQEELLERIKKLEERIAELEGKSETPPRKTEPASETATAEAPASEAESSATAPILDFFKATRVSGYVDAYYGYNTNDPESGIVDFRGLDTRHNSFQFDLAKIVFDRPAGETNSLGYRIDLVYGPAADTYHSFEPVGGQQEIIKNIQQAYVSYVAPVGDGLTVDVGKFGTFVGAEVLDTIDNFQYQQSILFGFAQPYYHTGVRTSYSASDMVDVGFYLVNGWNNSTDNNTGKSVGWSIAVSPNDNFSISQGYLGGPELDGLNNPWRHLFDTVISASVNDQVEFLFNYDYGFDAEHQPHFERTAWQGIAGAVRVSTADKKWAFSPRFEYFSDKDAFATGIVQDLKEITLTADYRARPNFSTKFEYRYDWSDQPFFTKGAGELVKTQNVFLIGFVYRFGFGEE